MKLRLTQAGFETYNGQMGVLMFENGLSTTDVLPVDAIRVSAAIGAEWEDGTPANVGEMYLNAMDVPAPMFEPAPIFAVDQTQIDAAAVAQAPQVVQTSGKTYTEDELAAIADKQGIAGLREIGTPLGVRAQSIRDLIDGILKVAGAPKAE